MAGVDEAGMAPLAGPVVAGAVILPKNYKLRGLNDSKKILDHETREELAAQIKQDAVCWSFGFAEVEEIDRINIYHAGLLAMQRALQGLTCLPDFVLVDARNGRCLHRRNADGGCRRLQGRLVGRSAFVHRRAEQTLLRFLRGPE